MYHYFGIGLLVLTTSLKSVLGVNYCDPSLCRKYTSNGGVYAVPHIGCNNKGAFGPDCPANAKVEILTDDLHNLILSEHNQYRNYCASGKNSGFKPASRMLPLKWNPDLANLALLNAKLCISGHDECRNTPTFKRSGQNKFRQSGSRPGLLILRDHLVAGVASWYDEFVYGNMTIINSWKATKPISAHFTAMCSDRQNYVGCGTVKFLLNSREYLITTCNYASTNIIGKPVYRSGPAASNCKTGRSTRYSSLCSSQEVIDPNIIRGEFF